MHTGDVLGYFLLSAAKQILIRLVIPPLRRRAAGTRTPLLLDIGLFPDESEKMSVFSLSSNFHINCFDVSPIAICPLSKSKPISELVFQEVRCSKEFVIKAPSDLYRLVSSPIISLFGLTKPKCCMYHYISFS